MKQSANQPYGKKAINFDLDISKMLATIGSKTAGYDRLKRAFKKMGFEYGESNPELEENKKVQSQWSAFESEQHKHRRAYKRKIC